MPEQIEPCGCDEANALRDILQGLVDYNDIVGGCDEGCECGFCAGKALLAALEEKRSKMNKHSCSSCDGSFRPL